ncbi:glycosyl transferase family 2 [Anaerococcus hydrogenalis]|uniref:Glycosyl transferase family 2 n=1 Tax=Anaerococcus hydrogenalis TaxID=33029 RepID=A0A2N6UJ42_9FIRM|nr:glycosyl transferase family 2 [Anaerococcus hydrogenalis]
MKGYTVKDKISVIVPIYKVEKYLDRCVKSLINQTYKNVEIILVDDGSPDNCPEMCDDYAIKDSRIKVIHKENGGLSDARNVGIEKSTGSYIAFVDSDDWVKKIFIEELYNNIKKENADISIIGYTLIWDSGKKITYGDNNDYFVYNQEDAIKELLKQKKFQCMVCQKMYKREIFNEIKFPVGEIYEDVAVSLPTFLKANKVVFSGKPMYFYYQREDSIVNEKFNENKLFFLDCCKEIIDYSNNHNKIFDKEAYNFYLRALLMLVLQLYSDVRTRNSEICKQLEKEVRKNKKHIFVNPYIDFKKRIALFMILVRFPRRLLYKVWRLKQGE